MVQCDRCRRWAYLDETDFACTDTADVAPFTCNFCNVVESLETRLRASEQEVETLGRVVRAMKDQIQAYHAKPDLSNDIPVEMPALQEPQEGTQRSCSSPADPNTSTALQTPPKEVALEVRQTEVEEENGQSPQTPQEQGRAPKTTLQNNENALPGDHIADRATEAASGSKEQAGEASSTAKAGKKGQSTEAESDRAAANGRPNANSQKARRQESKNAAPDSTPEVLIIGDGNVPRIAGALRRIWDNTVHVEQRSKRKATADRLQHLLRRHNDTKSRGAGLVVIHAGIQDVLNGSQPGDIAQAIRECVAPSTQRLVICSAPEVATRGKEMRAKAMLLNTELRKVCGALKATFVDLSDMLAGDERLAQDGIHYLSATTRQVATLLAQVIRPFLGLQGPRKSSGKPNHTSRGKSEPNVTAPETPTATPQPQGTKFVAHSTPHRDFSGNIQDLPQPIYLRNTAHLPTQCTQPYQPRAHPAPQTLELHRPQHLPDRPDVMASPPLICHPVHRGGVLASRPPGPSSVPLTWGPHLGTAHPTMTPGQTLSPSVSPELYQMVGDMIRQQLMHSLQWQHLMLPLQTPQ